MTPPCVWILGAGGLLGSAIRQRLLLDLPGALPWTPEPSRFSWTEPERIREELAAAAGAFAREVEASGRPWLVMWCAGAGIVGTPEDALARETEVFSALLDHLARALDPRPGALFFASSAGALYAGCDASPITEDVEPVTVSPYGRSKRRQEELLKTWTSARPHVSSLVGRLSNLYGPGQNLEKPQGLISHLSRCLLHHVPTHVYSPLDTLRDHLFATDAAARILRSLARLDQSTRPAHVVRIIASGQTASIATILGIFRRIARTHPRIVSAESEAGALQPRRLIFRSRVWEDLALPDPIGLPEGILRVHRAHLELLQAGRLPPPAPRA